MRRVVISTCAAMVVALVGLVAPPSQAGGVVYTKGTFDCRASAVRVKSLLVNSEPIVSNKAGLPCADDSDLALKITAGSLVTTGVAVTATDMDPDGQPGGHAEASVDDLVVNVGALVIKAKVVTSAADSRCVNGAPKLTSGSKVAGLTINGTPINVVDQSITIPASPLVVVAVNERTSTSTKVTQRALHVYSALLGVDIAVSESIASAKSCQQAPPTPQCSDTGDNDLDGKIDAADPGCHTDGNPGNPDSYDPNDNDETDPQPKPQCSDGADNDDDLFSDSNDVGCHTDGNPYNPNSYDPNDNDESNESKQCSDREDNDQDGKVDIADPNCHTDGNPNNPGSYDPNDDNEGNDS